MNSARDIVWMEAGEGGGIFIRTGWKNIVTPPPKELPPPPFRGFDLLKILQGAIPSLYRSETRVEGIFQSPMDYIISLRYQGHPVAKLDRVTERLQLLEFLVGKVSEQWLNDVTCIIDVLNEALRKQKPPRKIRAVKTKLAWRRGPENGGGGTAGGTAEASRWWDGDQLLVVVELSDGTRDVDVVRVHADEGMLSFRNRDDDDYGWGPEAIAWYAKLESEELPPKL